MINEWAIKWGISQEAIHDLNVRMGLIQTDPAPMAGKSEAAVQTSIRLEATEVGARLWRNNVGGFKTDEGGFVRYGLCNESAAMNKNIKSSDLIGCNPIIITQMHVGSVIGQFVARECKHGDWKYKGNKHEQAQLNFLNIVMSLGGDAAFAIGEGTL